MIQKTEKATAAREQLKLQIRDAAMPLFKAHGIKAVKMDDIAQLMGISKRTLYEVYRNKEELLHECIRLDAEQQQREMEAYASTARNEMDTIAFYLKQRLKGLGDVNPQFFSDMYKYKHIIEYFRQNNEQQRARSQEFVSRGIMNGFFRKDVNYDILHEISDACMQHVMKTEMYKRYDFQEIFHTFVFIYLRGCCTAKGLEYLDGYINENL